MRPFKFFDDDEVITQTELSYMYMEVEDTDTGECFGIPVAMSYAISHRGRLLYESSRTVSGRCNYDEYRYWIDNVYSTNDHTLVVEVTVEVPNTIGRGVTFHRIRQIIPYD